MEKPFEVCAEIEGDDTHYQPVSKHSSRRAAERAARDYENKTGLATWVDGPDEGDDQ
jgi:hypothetical protein